MALSFRMMASVVLAGAVVLMAGCETGRTNKVHSPADHIADDTTTSQQNASLPANGEGQPPVPGSPTAAGADGKQPYSDAWARASMGSEEGKAPPPAAQKKDAFERQ